jgi:hypothetical protein
MGVPQFFWLNRDLRRLEILPDEYLILAAHIRHNDSATSPTERDLHELRANSDTQSLRRAFSKLSAVSILSRIAQGLDSTQAVNASVCGSVSDSGSNALDLRVPLRDEILASIVILANVLSCLRIGPHEEGDKLSAGFQVHAALALPSLGKRGRIHRLGLSQRQA